MANREYDDVVRKKELVSEYEAKLISCEEKIKSELTDEQYAFLKKPFSTKGADIRSDIVKSIRNTKTPVSECILKKLRAVFDHAISKRAYNAVLYFADHLQEYPYSDSYYRRSFRAKDNGAYAEKLISIICRHSLTDVIDAPLDCVIERRLPEDAKAFIDEFSWKYCGYTEWQVAYALDGNDRNVEDAVRRILTEENSSCLMTIRLIRGVIISHRKDFHELLGKVLLAARLQEGLRQAICENADCGTIDAFLTLLNVIEENNLIRYSSVKRAVGTWLGILSDEARDIERVSEKSVRIMIDCLENESVRAEYLSSEDAMKIYIALWSLGFENIESALEKVAETAVSGSHHQLLVAGYFVMNLDDIYASSNIAKTVLRLHHDEDDVLAVWLPRFLPTKNSALHDAIKLKKPVDYVNWFDNREDVEENYRLMMNLYKSFSGKTKKFSPCIFPWYEASVSKSDFAEIICTLAAMLQDNDKIDEACTLIKECDSSGRYLYYSALLNDPKTPIQRKTVLEGIADKESYTRRASYEIVSGLKLSADEYRLLEEYLRFKNSDIRKNVMQLLMRQDNEALTSCISRLLESSKEDARVGGLDMLLQIKADAKRNDIIDALSERLRAMQSTSSKEKVLLDSLDIQAKKEEKTQTRLFSAEDKYLPTDFDADNIELCIKDFALVFPDSELPDQLRGKKIGASVFEKIKTAIKPNTACKSAIEAALDLMSLSKFIEAHKLESFTDYSGETMLLGNVMYKQQFLTKDKKLPLKWLWKEWVTKSDISDERAIRAFILNHAYVQKTRFSVASDDLIRTVFGAGFEQGKKLPYSEVIGFFLEWIIENLPREELLHLACALSAWFVRCVPDDKVMLYAPEQQNIPIHGAMFHLLAHKQLNIVYSWLSCKNDSELKYTFPLAVASAQRSIAAYKNLPKEENKNNGYWYYYHGEANTCMLIEPSGQMYSIKNRFVGPKEYLFAAYRGIITDAQLYEFLLNPDNISGAMEIVTTIASSYFDKGKQISEHNVFSGMFSKRIVSEFLDNKDEPDEEDIKLIRFVANVYEKIIPVVIESELSRGERPAEYSKGIGSITRIYGAKYFADILSSLGNDTLERGSYFFTSANNRKSSLSHLLAVCIPKDTDSPETLKEALAGRKITKKRIIEAALFSPEWIPIVGEYLGIASFESVCYYFMAHMNEMFDDKRKAMIAKFTPLSDEELNLGAFDADWFRSAYNSIGEKEFDLIYDAAKYISDGAKHSRARKYADATLGKYDVDEVEKTVSEKRNKDLLMAYALIPLKDEDDIFRRYLYIQKFMKESKQFGSQRAASESKAAETALRNLATNAGYSDTMRLQLSMETKIIDDNNALFEEHNVDGVSFRIEFDDNGKASLSSSKDGKALKNVPARLKKDETVIALNGMVKTLIEQYRRTRIMLERAMEDGTVFKFGELSALLTHPVVYPMIKNLVLMSGDTFGFIKQTGLADDRGVIQNIADDAEVKIAHPFELYKNKCWKNYQKYLFANEITQPFRQVFRELYIKTEDEIDAYHSLRYAGNQIQPAKTASVLKGRRWVADVEAGLQKVYYKENIIAKIYALADWFSPADIEAPTLEWVCFFDRKTGEEMRISKVPDIVFSEVMRDVDLAVSVAHVGGVDPETSHSTIEMRAAILSFVLPMFRIDNVKVDSHHAIINGKLADYSVHLGSGTVHQIGGSMIPVLPVHSQHKGKVFLPFVDDDPKTAEIISKVLLFAEDYKIKDPMILSAISK